MGTIGLFTGDAGSGESEIRRFVLENDLLEALIALRQRYYELLTQARTSGDWEAWMHFFADAVRDTASGAVATARSVVDLFNSDRERLRAMGRAGGSALRVHHELQRRPLVTVGWLVQQTGLSAPTVGKSLETLVRAGIAREITGRRRGRAFAYHRYVALLNEGTERP